MRIDLDFNLGKNFNLFLYGDDHMGNLFRYDEGVQMVFDMLHKPWADLKSTHNYMVHHGDPTESIFYNENRYDPESHRFKDTLFAQVRDVVKEYRKSRGKILVIMDGNHGNCAKVRPYGNPTLEICNQLQVPFGTYAAIVTYSDAGNILFRHYAFHGARSIGSRVKPYKRAKANMEIQLRSHLEHKVSNCVLMSMGHTHQLLTYRPDQQLMMEAQSSRLQARYSSPWGFYGDAKMVPADLRWYVNTGSMLKLTNINKEAHTGDYTSNNQHISGYAEMFGYDPIPMGFCIAEIRDGVMRDIKKIAVDAAGIKIID
jgi:hypothetical protein